MASIDKYTNKAAFSIIGHVDRTLDFSHMSNQDINFDRSSLNMQISPERGMSSYEYYKRIIDQCYVYGRQDVKTLAGVIITLPHDTPPSCADFFFRTSYAFLNERWSGEQAVVTCQIHMDEETPHMHYLFVPVTENLGKNGESRYTGPNAEREVERYKFKVSASDVLTRHSYLTFHDDFQQYLQAHGCPGTVKSGITKAQGRDMSVKEYKRETPLDREIREDRIRRNLSQDRNNEYSRFGNQSDYEMERSRF